jgi:hypothetical protein
VSLAIGYGTKLGSSSIRPIDGTACLDGRTAPLPAAVDCRRRGAVMSKDILEDLKSWLARVRDEKDIRRRMGRTPEIEIGKLERAIEEIERLRRDKP